MLKLSAFRAYVQLLQDTFPEITMSRVVMDDSQINKFLEDVKENDKHVLVGIIPKHKPIGAADWLKSKDTMSFLILKKVDRSDTTHDEFLDTLQSAQDITRKILLKITQDNIDGGDDCSIMARLDVPSIDINPIWALSSCDGYEIDFSLDSSF